MIAGRREERKEGRKFEPTKRHFRLHFYVILFHASSCIETPFSQTLVKGIAAKKLAFSSCTLSDCTIEDCVTFVNRTEDDAMVTLVRVVRSEVKNQTTFHKGEFVKFLPCAQGVKPPSVVVTKDVRVFVFACSTSFYISEGGRDEGAHASQGGKGSGSLEDRTQHTPGVSVFMENAAMLNCSSQLSRVKCPGWSVGC